MSCGNTLSDFATMISSQTRFRADALGHVELKELSRRSPTSSSAEVWSYQDFHEQRGQGINAIDYPKPSAKNIEWQNS